MRGYCTSMASHMSLNQACMMRCAGARLPPSPRRSAMSRCEGNTRAR